MGGSIGATVHNYKSISTHAFTYRKKFKICNRDQEIKHREIVIGNDVWIGCNVIIMEGIHVSDGAIIGAGAVVTHDVKPYEIVAGVPAQHLKFRFSEQLIKKLCSIKWWDLPHDTIKENIELFNPNKNIEEEQEILQVINDICKKGEEK